MDTGGGRIYRLVLLLKTVCKEKAAAWRQKGKGMEIHIDKEFESLIPGLSPEEYAQLEDNIIREGCRDALVVWDGILIDGHNRYKICTQHAIPFRTEEVTFEDRNAATVWIIRNQLGRRNLQLFQRSELALRMKGAIEEKARANCSAGGGDKKSEASKSGSQKSDEPINNMRTDEELAKLAGVSRDTIRKTEVILDKGSDEQIQRARQGGKGNRVNTIYQEIESASASETKRCLECGKEKLVTEFSKGRNVCKACINSRKVYRDPKGDPIHISREDSKRIRENTIKAVADLYNYDREIVYGIDDLAADLRSVAKTYTDQTGWRFEMHHELIQTDDDKQKIMAVLSEAETAIEEIRKEYLYD